MRGLSCRAPLFCYTWLVHLENKSKAKQIARRELKCIDSQGGNNGLR